MGEDNPSRAFMRDSIRVLSFFWRFARIRRWGYVAAAVAEVAYALISISFPLFYKQFFDIIAGPAAQLSISQLWHIVTIIAFLLLLRWAILRAGLVLLVRLDAKTVGAIEQYSFDHTIRHDQSFFSNSYVGAIVKKLSRLPVTFERMSTRLVTDSIYVVIAIVGAVAILTWRNIALGAVAITWIIVSISMQMILTRYKQKYQLQKTAQDSLVSAQIADAITNHDTVRVFAGSSREGNRLRRLLAELMRLRIFSYSFDQLVAAAWQFLVIALEVGLLSVAIVLWSRGLLTPGDFVLIQSYIMTIANQTSFITRLIQNFFNDIAEAHEGVEVTEAEKTVIDQKNATPLLVQRGMVEFSDVTFRYADVANATVIENLNLTIRPGEKVGVIGQSGAGKSTLVKLLLRLHDISHGTITIDGTNIRSVTQDSLREHISFVPQDPALFHRSLRENIAYGKPDATEEEIIEAAKKAHCHEFIVKLQNGYDTLVGERGVKLSGGERQRVAIARAILKNAPILILDEATSSLDSESESYIQDALRVLMEGKTVIVIAHRLSTIMQMDRIIVMEEGKIIDEGTHQDLIARDGVYQKLWNLQAGGFIAE